MRFNNIEKFKFAWIYNTGGRIQQVRMVRTLNRFESRVICVGMDSGTKLKPAQFPNNASSVQMLLCEYYVGLGEKNFCGLKVKTRNLILQPTSEKGVSLLRSVPSYLYATDSYFCLGSIFIIVFATKIFFLLFARTSRINIPILSCKYVFQIGIPHTQLPTEFLKTEIGCNREIIYRKIQRISKQNI